MMLAERRDAMSECPTCGGPATKRVVGDPEGEGTNHYEYEAKPCACGGRKPRARFTTDIVVGILDVHVPDGCPDGRVAVFIFDAAEEEGT